MTKVTKDELTQALIDMTRQRDDLLSSLENGQAEYDRLRADLAVAEGRTRHHIETIEAYKTQRNAQVRDYWLIRGERDAAIKEAGNGWFAQRSEIQRLTRTVAEQETIITTLIAEVERLRGEKG